MGKSKGSGEGWSPLSRRTGLASLFGKKVSRDAKGHTAEAEKRGTKHGWGLGKRGKDK